MKTELITNVSHDLKTPLTAIITYVNLLKKEGITEEERRNYIRILDQKSMRLKSLIEDLFEISKANSNNVTLHLVEVDIVSLMKQVRLELEDKIGRSQVEFRWNMPDDKAEILIGEARASEAIRKTEYRTDVIGSNTRLAGASLEMIDLPARESRLRKALAEVQKDYDFIFIDCPPSLDLLTLNGLSACDSVLIPVQCEYYALEGLSELISCAVCEVR